ncbi:MAG: ribose-5-phosphate isomerase RpiA [Planctomycetes bacterium]|nr:ribose-5-phosphate isomerase RpiA [Planctomycetota bacterium]MBI3843485.1 ribose-5-phosphate isomerase RpiA [Planctomycetota bacterium]
MADVDRLKALAAERALEFISNGMVVGLGTGSTAKHLIRLLGERVRGGFRVLGVPTSIATEKMAREAGIPLTTLAEHAELDLVIDGADEVDPARNLLKGGGGALVREKIVAAAARSRVIIVDETKLVDVLGRRFALPVEVIPFAVPTATAAIARLGGRAELRLTSGSGNAFVSDNGNPILDCRFGDITDPARLERDVTLIPGVVDCGLFVGFDPIVVVAAHSGTRIIR